MEGRGGEAKPNQTKPGEEEKEELTLKTRKVQQIKKMQRRSAPALKDQATSSCLKDCWKMHVEK